MESQGIRAYMAGSAQDYASLGGQKRTKNENAASSALPSGTTQEEQAPAVSKAMVQTQDYPALSADAAWSLLGEVQAEALSSSPYKLAEAQPVSTRSLVPSTYA